MSDREELLQSLSGNASDETHDEQHIDPPADEPIEPPAENDPNAEPIADSAAMEGESAASLLDSLTLPPRGEGGKFEKKDGDDAKPEGAAKPDEDAAAKAKTADEEAEALIKEMGVKSERGQERIRATFTKLKETEAKAAEQQAKATEYEQDINQFKEMVKQTRMSPEQFGDVLEIGRLANSDSVAEKKLALERLDAHRAQLAKELGVDVPGVDVLDDFPDLKAKVENLDMTREDAIRLAKFERQERAQQQAAQSRQQVEQETSQYQDDMNKAAETATAIFNSFAHETDYPAKMKLITEFVKQPGKLEEIAQTYAPQQLPKYFRDLYANIRVAAPAPATDPQPLRSRNVQTGARVANGPIDNAANISSHLDALGI